MIAQKSTTSATTLVTNDLVGNILETRKATKETLALIVKEQAGAIAMG
jgi:hypothetical protein